MKINNKGMAISGILYSILILFLVLLFGILALLASGKYTFDKLKTDIVSKLSGNKVNDTTDASCFQFEHSSGTITGFNFNRPGCTGDIIIPDVIDYIAVKKIGDKAFYNVTNFSIQTLDFSNAMYLSSIGLEAFYTTTIQRIEFGNLVNLSSIGNYAFAKAGITEIVIGNLSGLSTIGDGAFANNNLTAIDFSTLIELKSIGSYAFINNQLSDLELLVNNKLTTIGSYSFQNNVLTDIDFPMEKTITSIGTYAFSKNAISDISFLAGNNGLTEISAGVFSSNNIQALNFTNLPNISSIGDYAFSNNIILSIDFTNMTNMTSLGKYAFATNIGLISSNIEKLVNLTTIKEGAFFDAALTSVNFPSKLVTIGEKSYYSNNITAVNLTSLQSNGLIVGSLAFFDNKIADLQLPTLISYMGGGAFTKNLLPEAQAYIYARDGAGGTIWWDLVSYGGSATTNVKIPTSVVTIQSYAFAGVGIKSISPQGTGVTNIQAGAFGNNGFNTAINLSVYPDLAYIGQYAFYGMIVYRPLLVTQADSYGITKYYGDTQYTLYTKSSTMGTLNLTGLTKLVTIDQYAFSTQGITTLTGMNTLTSLSYIGGEAFKANNTTGTLDLSNTKLTAINWVSFGWNSFTTLLLPSTVTLIDQQAFSNNQITSVTIPANVTRIVWNGFANNKIASLTFEGTSKLTTIETNGFYNNLITSLTLPESLVIIGNSAFNINSLTTVSIGTKVTNIGTTAFGTNPTLTAININRVSGSITGSPWGATNATVTWTAP